VRGSAVSLSTTLRKLLTVAGSLVILKTVITVLLSYRGYFPPDFQTDFLLGRERYFFGSYQWSFYAHIVSGPMSLLFGVLLLSVRLRKRFPKLHRVMGRVQVFCVLGVVTPSGLWMSFYTESNSVVGAAVAGSAFAALAIATGWTVALGWRAAVKRKLAVHRLWMWRCYVLLCSAVVLRIIGGLAIMTELESDWVYPVAAWGSWIVPLVMFEAMNRFRNRRTRGQT